MYDLDHRKIIAIRMHHYKNVVCMAFRYGQPYEEGVQECKGFKKDAGAR